MPGILFIHGDEDFSRRTFHEEGRANWSRALEVVLEKHGLLGFERIDAEAIASPDVLRRFDVVLVGRIREEQWTPGLVREVSAGTTPVLAEGPLPSVVERAAGVERHEILCDPSGEVADGAVVVRDRALRDAAALFGGGSCGAVTKSYSRPVEQTPGWHWSSIEGVPLTDEQATAWRRPAWDAVRWSPQTQARVLAEWIPYEGARDPSPAIIRSGRLVACSFGLFAFLGQRHSAAPCREGEMRTALSPAGVEALFLGLVDLLHRQAGAARVRVLPWPRGVRWVRNVRHDFDRGLSGRRVGGVVRRHARAGTAATWYWRARRADPAVVDAVPTKERHEIALHTEGVWKDGDREQARLEAAVGEPVAGTSAHGLADSFRFQGAPNVLWAASRGMRYTEMLETRHFHPFRFPTLTKDGLVELLHILCLPHHESFDISMRRGDFAAEHIKRVPETWARRRGFLQVLNHPDIHVKPLFSTLRGMPSTGRADWVARDVAAWWGTTHVATEMEMRHAEGRSALRARHGAEDLVVETALPSGSVQEHALSLEPGEWTDLPVAAGEGS